MSDTASATPSEDRERSELHYASAWELLHETDAPGDQPAIQTELLFAILHELRHTNALIARQTSALAAHAKALDEHGDALDAHVRQMDDHADALHRHHRGR